jgi:hypothetical protein
MRIKRRYEIQSISIKFLFGIWKNEWTFSGNAGAETVRITDDAKYLVNEEHWFNIEDFKYDAKKRQIRFTKVAIRPNDRRRLLNILTIKNNELLTGTENNREIKYSKISN